MAKKVGIISINLQAGTAQFNADLGKAKAKVIEFGAAGAGSGRGTRQSMIEASASIRALEGNFNNNIRAVERFTSVTLGLGPLFNKIFPLVGGLAFGSMLVELGEKAHKFFQDVSNSSEKLAGAFRELQDPLRMTNDELAVTNARLEIDIAKLEGHPHNNLKLALAEVMVAADKLAESLDKDIGKLNTFLSDSNISRLKQFATALIPGMRTQVSTTAFTEEMGGKTGQGGFTRTMHEAEDAANDKIRGLVKANDLRGAEKALIEANTQRERLLDAEIKKVGASLAINRLNQQASGGKSGKGGADWEGLIEQQEMAIRNLKELRRGGGLQMENFGLTQKKQALEARPKVEEPGFDKFHGTVAGAGVGALLELLKLAQDANEIVIKESDIAKDKTEEFRQAQEKAYTEGLLRITAHEDEASALDLQTEATQRLTAAIGQGSEAVRKAELINKLALISAKTPSAPLAAATVREDTANRQKQAAEAGAGTNRIQKISDEIELLKKANAVGAERLSIDLKIKDLESERVRAMAGQALEMGGARNEMRAFFQEMSVLATEPSRAFFDGMMSAVDKTSDALAKLLTGQKANWGAMFRGIGEDMIKSTAKQGIAKGISAVADKFHIPGLDAKPDGTRSKYFWVKDVDGASSKPQIGSTPSMDQSGVSGEEQLGTRSFHGGGGIFDVLKSIPFIGGLFGGGGGGSAAESVSSSFAPMASGGPVSAGSAYMVGESGREAFFPGQSGTIMNAGNTARMMGAGGDTHNYWINVDGDKSVYRQQTEMAIRAAHQSAIGTSVRAMHDQGRRMPAHA